MSINSRKREDEAKLRSERLAYVGALAAGLVHEVRTPLHAIQLNAQLLAEDAANLPEDCSQKFARRSQRIFSEVKALSKTLEMFLTFARPPRMEPEPLDLNRFLRELCEFVQPEMDENGVELETHLAPDMYPVVIDQNQFTHVILNILRNANEAIDQRREVDDDFEGIVKLSTFEENKTIRIEVADNGIGISPENEDKIFEVFYTTKEKGTGLGLGIVKRIIEDHRGTITVSSKDTHGAAFNITLPRGYFITSSESSAEQ